MKRMNEYGYGALFRKKNEDFNSEEYQRYLREKKRLKNLEEILIKK